MASFIQSKRGAATDSQAQANALIAQLAELKRLKQADEAEKRMVTDLESTMKHRDLGQENKIREMTQDDRKLSQADINLLREAEALKLQQAAEAHIEAKRHGWTNPKHAAQWSSTLETYAYPSIGHLAVRDVSTQHVLDILDPIWSTKTETATRVRQRIESEGIDSVDSLR